MIEELFNNCPWYVKIKLLRILKGWGQEKAADMCSTYKKNYWQWENGQCYPTLKNKKRIAAVFGINMNYIFSPNDQTIRNANNNI